MITMNPSQLRHLSDLSIQAAAGLIPLAADGIGGDHHGGRLPDPAGTLERALGALIDAGRLAGQIRANAGASGGSAGGTPRTS